LLGWHDRLSRMLSENQPWESDEVCGAWLPPVDILERGDDLLIRAELPGVKIEDIDVRVENNVLRLSGERRREGETEEGKSFRRERSYGAFTRAFSLPATVDATKIKAQLRNGVLEISLPKAEEAKPRKVEIKAA
jgi:HSP20 family protein